MTPKSERIDRIEKLAGEAEALVEGCFSVSMALFWTERNGREIATLLRDLKTRIEAEEWRRPLSQSDGSLPGQDEPASGVRDGEASAFTPGPWLLCTHLRPGGDEGCPCGYRGGIWGPDQERIICEMGGTTHPGEEGLEPERYSRPTELANARLIAAAPDHHEAAREIDRLSLVILSAINFADKPHLEAVGSALRANRAAIAKALGPSAHDTAEPLASPGRKS